MTSGIAEHATAPGPWRISVGCGWHAARLYVSLEASAVLYYGGMTHWPCSPCKSPAPERGGGVLLTTKGTLVG